MKGRVCARVAVNAFRPTTIRLSTDDLERQQKQALDVANIFHCFFVKITGVIFGHWPTKSVESSILSVQRRVVEEVAGGRR